MIAVDTNILVYAHHRDSAFHANAYDALGRLAEGRAPWAIPWACLREFYAVTTRKGLYANPSSPQQAVAAIQGLLAAPTLVLLSEGPRYWEALREMLMVSQVAGPRIHDASIAAICLDNGVRELWTADRDFGRFPQLKTVNPLKHGA